MQSPNRLAAAAVVGAAVLFWYMHQRKQSSTKSDDESFHTSNFADRVKRLRHPEKLPPAMVPALGSASVLAWRQAYRRNRLGQSHGAKGEVSMLGGPKKKGSSLAQHMQLMRNASFGSLDEEVYASGEGGHDRDEDPWDSLEQAQALITAYRLAYQRHRTGAAGGAKGELSNLVASLDVKAFRLLPAAQVAAMAAAEKGTATTGQSDLLAGGDARLHVHFGAGRLGLGLVLPAVAASGAPFCVVQRPSSAFEPLERSPDEAGQPLTVALTVNGMEYPGSNLALVTCINDMPFAWKVWLKSRAEDRTLVPPPTLAPQGLFVCGQDPALLSLVASASTSFSSSLGPGLAGLAKALPQALSPPPPTEQEQKQPVEKGGCPALFAGENDHGAVEELATALKGRVHVVSCMVDRICTGRAIRGPSSDAGNDVDGGDSPSHKGGSGKAAGPTREVAVTSEPYGGSLVVLTPPAWVNAPPFVGPGVLVPRVSAQADYLCSRKLLMVNGLHTVLAFMTLASKVPSSDQVGLASDKLVAPWADLVLITPKDATPQQQRTVWCWAVARLLVLLFEWDLEVIRSAHSCHDVEGVVDVLLAYAKQTIGRFDTAKDVVGRILGGGVANRYNGRLLPVRTFLRDKIGTQVSGSSGSGANGSASPARRNMEAVVAKLSPSPGNAVGSSGSVTRLLLRKADVTMPELQEAVELLTADSLRFIGRASLPAAM